MFKKMFNFFKSKSNKGDVSPKVVSKKKCVFCDDTGFMVPGKWRNNVGNPCTQGCSPKDFYS